MVHMSLEQQMVFSDIGFILVVLGVPPLICLPIIPLVRRLHPLVRWVLSILGGWAATVFYHMEVSLPLAARSAAQAGDYLYDGTLGSAVVLILAWIPPFVAGIFLMLAEVFYVDWKADRLVRRKTPLKAG